MTETQRQPAKVVLPIPPSPLLLAEQQTTEAQAERKKDFSAYPHLPWPNAMELMGPMLPGQMWIVGARPGNGKTTFLLNLLDDLASQRQPVLYLTTETRASEMRSLWAAMCLGYQANYVLENAWTKLPEAAQGEVSKMLDWQGTSLADIACFVDLPSLTVESATQALRGARDYKFQTVILDHVHRWHVQDTQNVTGELNKVVRWLKGVAAKTGLTLLVAAQLNRPDKSPLAEFLPPPLSALKQAGALEEESNVVIMLHRQRKVEATAAMAKEVNAGQRDIRDLIEPNIMCVAVAKHRNRPATVGRLFRLMVRDSCRLEDPRHPTVSREPGEEPGDLPF